MMATPWYKSKKIQGAIIGAMILGVLGIVDAFIERSPSVRQESHGDASPNTATSGDNSPVLSVAGDLVIQDSASPQPENPNSILKPTWIPVPGSQPIIDGQASLRLQPLAESFVFLSVAADVSWVGYEKQHTMQMETTDRRLFDFNGQRYAVDLLALQSNKAQCAVSRIVADR